MKEPLSRSRRRQSGQLLPIAAAAFLVMCALAGLAIDSSRDYLVKRDAQNAADFAVLAATKEMTYQSNLSSPIAANSAPLQAAHDFAANNGFSTIFSSSCDQSLGSSFSTTWFDVAGLPCSSNAGFQNKVSVNSPPVALPGNPIPLACAGAAADSCVQVTITTRIGELFTSVLGIPFAYVTVSAAAQATLPASSFDAPPPVAAMLYQPQAGCDAAEQQCFNESKPAARTLLSCSTTGSNCPTFWARHGTAPKIYGYDGSVLNPPGDYTALQSNGDMVIQDRTTICDAFGGAACAAGSAVGSRGFAVPAGTKLYCTRIGGGGVGGPCTTTGQATLNEIDSNQAPWIPTNFWYPTVSTAGLKDCGSLVLNGQAMYGPCADPQEPYLIGSGIYDYIVINHGTYEFASGLYDVLGTAPVNSATGSGYLANGIDHSQENASDFDLCTGGAPTSCPTLKAGVWIGHGGGSFYAYQGPTPGSCTNGVAGSGGGGGDPTVISGSGVVFRLEAGGFVSTHEVSGMTLAGAGVGAVAAVNGSPLLFDLENSSFIHLDSSQPGAGVPPNTTSGIIYQNPNFATAGGVEFDPSMAGFDTQGVELPAIQGQVLAYSLTIFGQSGGTMDFSQGYGGGSVPGIGTSGRDETSIISPPTLRAGPSGYSVLTVPYQDEWMMDAYDVYVKINNGSPQFFSEGIWNSVPGPGTPLPPPINNPGDSNPAYPNPGVPGQYTIRGGSDWVYTIPNSNGSTIEAKGGWAWGHQNTIPNAQTANYTAHLIYTFPNPAGNYLSVTVFFLDGDRCGDYAYVNYTFRSTGGPGPGQQSVGSVTLVG
ncbi:MAG TPA: pilus assembly protein TadG-related protein [Candidatus Dormibacteraeota bacterium]|nr:pilus assembly protein TadG-related protein [Candidatus Dormibacteraeota bacterium]